MCGRRLTCESGPTCVSSVFCPSLSFLSFTGGTEAIIIKPVEDSDAAQAPLAEWMDLALYARGIVERQVAIPPDLLSLPHGLTPLPLEPPLRFVAEPYVATDKCAPLNPHKSLLTTLTFISPLPNTAQDHDAGGCVPRCALLSVTSLRSYPFPVAVGFTTQHVRLYIKPELKALCGSTYLDVTAMRWQGSRCGIA